LEAWLSYSLDNNKVSVYEIMNLFGNILVKLVQKNPLRLSLKFLTKKSEGVCDTITMQLPAKCLKGIDPFVPWNVRKVLREHFY